MQGWDQVGHCNVCKPMTKWDTLMCDPPIYSPSELMIKEEGRKDLEEELISKIDES